jgi:hypothetical protein
VAVVARQSTQVQRTDPVRSGWIGRMRRAFVFGLDRDTIVVALAGFLLRGGIVVLMLPSVVLPSVIGLAGATGVTAFAIDGRPTPRFYEMAAIAAALVAVWLIVALLIGSMIDVWLIEAAGSDEPHPTDQPRPLPELRTLIDMMGVRAICLVPLGLVLTWAGEQIYAAIYNELTVPSNLATPLPLRVVESAGGAVVVVALVWLATEVVGAVAVRRLVLFETGVLRSLRDGIGQLLRRPVSSAATIGLSYGVSVLAASGALLATATAFDWCRIAARNQVPIAKAIGIGSFSTTRDIRGPIFAGAVIALSLAWLAALSISGVASAWRSAALTNETADATRNEKASRLELETELGLSGSPRETSGD